MARLADADLDALSSHYTGNCFGCDRCSYWPAVMNGEPGAAEAYAAYMASVGRPVQLVDDDPAPGGDELPRQPSPELADQRRCLRCGSDRLVTDAKVVDNADVPGTLHVELGKKFPDAWLFDGAVQVEVVADLCGSCGHVELRVADPEAMWAQFEALRSG